VDAAKAGDLDTPVTVGHDVSMELEMKECATWLEAFVPEVSVEFIPAGEPFWSVG
jgi:hypothetical protein